DENFLREIIPRHRTDEFLDRPGWKNSQGMGKGHAERPRRRSSRCDSGAHSNRAIRAVRRLNLLGRFIAKSRCQPHQCNPKTHPGSDELYDVHRVIRLEPRPFHQLEDSGDPHDDEYGRKCRSAASRHFAPNFRRNNCLNSMRRGYARCKRLSTNAGRVSPQNENVRTFLLCVDTNAGREEWCHPAGSFHMRIAWGASPPARCFFGLSAFSAPPCPESAVADEGCGESNSFLFLISSFLSSLYFLCVLCASAVSLILFSLFFLFSVLSVVSLCLAGVQRHGQMKPLPGQVAPRTSRRTATLLQRHREGFTCL